MRGVKEGKGANADYKLYIIPRYVAKQGFLDLTAHDYQLVFGVEVNFVAYILLMTDDD